MTQGPAEKLPSQFLGRLVESSNEAYSQEGGNMGILFTQFSYKGRTVFPWLHKGQISKAEKQCVICDAGLEASGLTISH